MSEAAWVTLTVVAGCILLQVFERIRASAGFLGATVVLLLTGVLTPAEAFGGFGNSAPVTVAALFVAARAIEKAGILARVTQWVLAGQGHGRLPLAKLTALTGSLSALVNNTPLVAVAAPLVSDWAHRRGVATSRFLMPLSYAAILGGVATTIGTSTNLVVSGMLEDSGYGALALFDITPVGLPVAIVGCALMVWLAPLLLPERRTALRQFEEGAREFVVSMRVSPNGPLDGVSAERGGLRNLQSVFLFEIRRGSEVIAPVAPSIVFQSGDLLSFAGQVDRIVDLQHMPGLESAEAKHMTLEGQHVLVEAVIGGESPLAGRTLREAQFRQQYQAAVLAIHRAGSRVMTKLGAVRLQAGDTLLLLTDSGFINRWRHRRDFLLVAQLNAPAPAPARHAWRAAAIALAMVVPVALDLVPMLQMSLAAAFAFVLAGVLAPSEAFEAIDIDLYVMIAASFGLGIAMEKTGLAATLASGLIWVCQDLGRVGPIVGVVVATIVVTEFVTNNAAAAVMFPIAAATAASAGIDVRSMAIAVAVMSSCSFLTPIGYQTNMMVYGPGGYRFLDYLRLGLPLTVSSAALVIWLTAP